MNALTKFQGGQIQLSDAERLLQEMMMEDESAFDMQPLRVKIAPGGIGQFLMGDETAKTFNAVVAISQKIRGYWPETGTDKPPVCSSPDGSIGFFNSELSDEQFKAATGTRLPHPGVISLSENKPVLSSYNCLTCPMSQWNSEHQRKGGKGKACKEMRRLLLLIDGWSLPAILALPPTSIKVWDAYCSSLQAKRGAYFGVKTKFELDSAKAVSGETYNFVKVSVSDRIADIESIMLVSEIRKQYRELVSQMPVVADEYETVDASSGNADVIIEPDGDDRTPPF